MYMGLGSKLHRAEMSSRFLTLFCEKLRYGLAYYYELPLQENSGQELHSPRKILKYLVERLIMNEP